MVSLNGFKVVVKEGREVQRNGDTYIEMQHGQKYTIGLGNNRSTRCRVEVWIDGTRIGVWILPAHDFDTIEHPTHDNGCFTFYRVNSAEGDAIGLSPEDFENGLIKVIFTPEKEMLRTPECGVTSKNINPYNAGGTGLSGHSSQEYGRTADIPEHMRDRSNVTVIYLRLVERKKYYSQPRSLKAISNAIPPAVG